MKPALLIVVVLTLILAACQTAKPTETAAPVLGETQSLPPAPAEATPETAVDEPYPGAVELVDPNATPAYPAPDEGGTPVEWEEATKLILEGKVAQVTQYDNLTVILVLKDGQTMSTLEPALDEVFNLIEECGDLCKDIEVPTS